jgi:hypothetical protein
MFSASLLITRAIAANRVVRFQKTLSRNMVKNPGADKANVFLKCTNSSSCEGTLCQKIIFGAGGT